MSATAVGQLVEGWTTVAVAWCSIEHNYKGHEDEREIVGHAVAFAYYEVNIRYRNDLRPGIVQPGTHRLLLDGRPLNIVNVFDPDGRKETIRLFCEEQQSL
jgi:head-tail adaptor